MKVVYLGGAYRADSINRMHEQQENARQYATRIWIAGAVCICPHLNSRMMDGVAPDGMFLAGYLELVERSDALALMPGWNRSAGSIAEKQAAEADGKPVFDLSDGEEALHQWIKESVRMTGQESKLEQRRRLSTCGHRIQGTFGSWLTCSKPIGHSGQHGTALLSWPRDTHAKPEPKADELPAGFNDLDNDCGEPNPESGEPCYFSKGHKGLHCSGGRMTWETMVVYERAPESKPSEDTAPE